VRVRALLSTLAVIAVVATGCGGDDEGREGAEREAGPVAPAASPEATPPSDRAATTARRGRKIKVVDSQFGRILANGRGLAVFYFDKEATRESECYGACARAWPPVLTNGKPRAGEGARSRLLGRTERRNGRSQVTYDGHPLYYYVDDSPGRVLCHNVREFGGLWLVVRPDGSPVG
jgi:predicted lipoprotein with Yx(FWY)xxD motif